MFERCATGPESDRTLAAWLNAKGARTARGRLFSKDTALRQLVLDAIQAQAGGRRAPPPTDRTA